MFLRRQGLVALSAVANYIHVIYIVSYETNFRIACDKKSILLVSRRSRLPSKLLVFPKNCESQRKGRKNFVL